MDPLEFDFGLEHSFLSTSGHRPSRHHRDPYHHITSAEGPAVEIVQAVRSGDVNKLKQELQRWHILTEELLPLHDDTDTESEEEVAISEKSSSRRTASHVTPWLLHAMQGTLPGRSLDFLLSDLLRLAAENGQLECVETLVLAGAWPIPISSDDFNAWSRTSALHLAAANGHADVVRFLVGLGDGHSGCAKVSSSDALNLAAGNAHLEAVNVLIQYQRQRFSDGSGLSCDRLKRLARSVAQNGGHTEMVSFLQDHANGKVEVDHACLLRFNTKDEIWCLKTALRVYIAREFRDKAEQTLKQLCRLGESALTQEEMASLVNVAISSKYAQLLEVLLDHVQHGLHMGNSASLNEGHICVPEAMTGNVPDPPEYIFLLNEALLIAVRRGRSSIVKKMLQRGAMPTNETRELAQKQPSSRVAKLLGCNTTFIRTKVAHQRKSLYKAFLAVIKCARINFDADLAWSGQSLLQATQQVTVSAGPRCLCDALDAQALSKLCDALESSDAYLRVSLVKLLGELGQCSVFRVAELRRALQDPVDFVRSHAARSIGLIGQPAFEAITDLAQALEDEDRFVRCSAAEALAKMEDAATSIIPMLWKALADEVLFVRSNAAIALGRILGTPLHPGLHVKIEGLKSDTGKSLNGRHAVIIGAGEDGRWLVQAGSDSRQVSIKQENLQLGALERFALNLGINKDTRCAKLQQLDVFISHVRQTFKPVDSLNFFGVTEPFVSHTVIGSMTSGTAICDTSADVDVILLWNIMPMLRHVDSVPKSFMKHLACQEVDDAGQQIWFIVRYAVSALVSDVLRSMMRLDNVYFEDQVLAFKSLSSVEHVKQRWVEEYFDNSFESQEEIEVERKRNQKMLGAFTPEAYNRMRKCSQPGGGRSLASVMEDASFMLWLNQECATKNSMGEHALHLTSFVHTHKMAGASIKFQNSHIDWSIGFADLDLVFQYASSLVPLEIVRPISPSLASGEKISLPLVVQFAVRLLKFWSQAVFQDDLARENKGKMKSNFIQSLTVAVHKRHVAAVGLEPSVRTILVRFWQVLANCQENSACIRVDCRREAPIWFKGGQAVEMFVHHMLCEVKKRFHVKCPPIVLEGRCWDAWHEALKDQSNLPEGHDIFALSRASWHKSHAVNMLDAGGATFILQSFQARNVDREDPAYLVQPNINWNAYRKAASLRLASLPKPEASDEELIEWLVAPVDRVAHYQLKESLAYCQHCDFRDDCELVPQRNRTCGHCRAVSYCSRACQRADWAEHKDLCCLASYVYNALSSRSCGRCSIERLVGIRDIILDFMYSLPGALSFEYPGICMLLPRHRKNFWGPRWTRAKQERIMSDVHLSVEICEAPLGHPDDW